jgi:hypothetical protein
VPSLLISLQADNVVAGTGGYDTQHTTTTRQHQSTTRVFRISRKQPQLSFSIDIICTWHGDTKQHLVYVGKLASE